MEPTEPIRNEAWDSLFQDFEEPLTMIDGPLKMANMFAMTMANAKNADLNVPFPVGAKEWAESIFERWFELVGEIAKSSGIRQSLLDRDLYDPMDIDNSPSWNDGLKIEDLPHLIEGAQSDVDDSSEILEELYGPLGLEPFALIHFGVIKNTNNTLSGQYNRLFPVKLVLRTAASMISSRDEYDFIGNEEDDEFEYDELLLENLRNECLKVARYAKAKFEWIDKQSGNNMGEKLSVGFPTGSGDDSKIKKQAERFVSQFVGSVRNKGQGLPFELGLLVVDNNGEVKFTENGARFMMMKNPLFDTNQVWKNDDAFSQEEKQFLVSMIKRNVPGEFEFMCKTVKWISEGTNTPKPIEIMISKEMDVSKTEASLLRSGTLARMIELGIINREQSGRNVTYHVSSFGHSLISK